MEFSARVGLAFVLLGCFLGGMLALDTLGTVFLPQDTGELIAGSGPDQPFTKAAFLYGPQSWRPGSNPLGIYPGNEVNESESWYLMFVSLNASPVAGDPNLRRIGSVRITYNLTGLSGRAVFGTYGMTTGAMATRTNRQTGVNYCGYVVTGTAAPGRSMPSATPMAASGFRQYRVTLSENQREDSDNLDAPTRLFHFSNPGSGEAALHITHALTKRMGSVTETTALNGTFYVTATGGDPGNELLLMVAVDRPQPDNFSLRVRTDFLRSN